MTLNELLDLIPETHPVTLVCCDYFVRMNESAALCMFSKEVMDMKVDNIEAESNSLKIWLGFNENAEVVK